MCFAPPLQQIHTTTQQQRPHLFPSPVPESLHEEEEEEEDESDHDADAAAAATAETPDAPVAAVPAVVEAVGWGNYVQARKTKTVHVSISRL